MGLKNAGKTAEGNGCRDQDSSCRPRKCAGCGLNPGGDLHKAQGCGLCFRADTRQAFNKGSQNRKGHNISADFHHDFKGGQEDPVEGNGLRFFAGVRITAEGGSSMAIHFSCKKAHGKDRKIQSAEHLPKGYLPL